MYVDLQNREWTNSKTAPWLFYILGPRQQGLRPPGQGEVSSSDYTASLAQLGSL